MAWRRSSREIWDEFDRMMSDMQRQFSEAVQRLPGTAQQSPVPETVIDVLEHDTAVVVIADLPGVEREGISIRLLDPRTLRITARREDVHEEQEMGYHVQERRFGAISRTVTLPADVRGEEAIATFKNGVLEVQLKKVAATHGKVIAIGAAAEQSVAEARREQIEEEYREDKEKVKPSGYLSPRDIMEAEQNVQIEDTGSHEEQEMAAKLRRQKEQMYEEGKKRLAEQEAENPSR
jgi:HSP20 family protein